MKGAYILILIGAVSCSPFSRLKKREFVYATPGESESVNIMVPSRFTKRVKQTDTTGNAEEVYHYSNGSFLYFVRVLDTSKKYQQMDSSLHIPRIHPNGGLIYKGMEKNGKYWREIRTSRYRFGYRHVPAETEILFDSSLNYAAQDRVR